MCPNEWNVYILFYEQAVMKGLKMVKSLSWLFSVIAM